MEGYFLVALGGMLGAVARYALSGLVSNAVQGKFPLGTLAVNLIGSFVIGFFQVLALEKFTWSPQWRVFFATGFLGAFTTFSTFSYETVELVREGAYLFAALNVGASFAGCLTAVFVGMIVAGFF